MDQRMGDDLEVRVEFAVEALIPAVPDSEADGSGQPSEIPERRPALVATKPVFEASSITEELATEDRAQRQPQDPRIGWIEDSIDEECREVLGADKKRVVPTCFGAALDIEGQHDACHAEDDASSDDGRYDSDSHADRIIGSPNFSVVCASARNADVRHGPQGAVARPADRSA